MQGTSTQGLRHGTPSRLTAACVLKCLCTALLEHDSTIHMQCLSNRIAQEAFIRLHTVETLFAQQDAGTIEVLPVYLHRGYPSHIQLEALHAMYNMCKISPTRQEAAALAGVVPLLVKLAVSPPPEAPLSTTQPPAQSSGAESVSNSGEDVASVSGRALYPLRPLAVSLLCGMAHSTHRTRHELWAHNVVALLLDLLKEEVTCAFCCAKLVCVVIIC